MHSVLKLFKIAFVLSLISCGSNSFSKEAENSKSEIEVLKPTSANAETRMPSPKTSNLTEKVNLKEELQEEFGDYLVTLGDSILQLVDPGGLYNPFYSFDTTDLKNSLIGFEMRIHPTRNNTYEFSKNDSKIWLQYWEVEELSAEYSELNGVNITGKLSDKNIRFSSGISFGMTLKEFLSMYFDNYDGVIDGVKTIVAWKDERGDSATVYYFQDGLLETIEFGNHNY